MHGITLHRSHRLEALAAQLARDLRATRPADPMQPQAVVVGSRGMDRWLRHRVADAHGICANLRFDFPAKAIHRLLDAFAPAPAVTIDPWQPDALAWRVLDALPTLLADPDFAPVASYLGPPEAEVSRRAYGLARDLADVLDHLHLARPAWIQHWLGQVQHDAPPQTPTAAWQQKLWQHLREGIDVPSPPERLAEALRTLQAGEVDPGLPALHIFGVSALPPPWLDLLTALSAHIPVGLYLFAPSNDYWADFRTAAEARSAERKQASDLDALDEALARQHPLLTSLGRVSRDMQHLLLVHCEHADDHSADALFEEAPPSSLLTHVQADLRHLRAPAMLTQPHALQADDHSVQVWSCPGAARQADALRQALLSAFDEDPSLRPRDVVVLTPDVELYGPLIEAALQQGGPGDPTGPSIPAALFDRSLRSLNPVAEALLRLLQAVETRLTAPDLADMLGLDPVRRRFDIEEADVSQVREWLRTSGFRWGLDAADRARLGQPADAQGTLAFALRRLCLGQLAADDGPLLSASDGPPVAPFDAMEGQDTRLLGQLSQLADALETHLPLLREPRSLTQWAADLGDALDATTQPHPDAPWQRAQVFDLLHTLSIEAQGCERRVSLSAIRHALSQRLSGAPSDDRPATGAVTISALTPMRSVPFKVVCLVGLDDGRFPRQGARRSWDLSAAHPRPGDRNPRDDDRHLILESILSARSHLIITYAGADALRGAEQPPAAPVAELLDLIDASFSAPEGMPSPRAHVLRTLPVQPFEIANFQPPQPSYDGRMLGVAQRLAAPRTPHRPAHGLTLPAPTGPIDIDDLARVLRQPAAALLRRLRVFLWEQDPSLPDQDPLTLTGLERWQARSALIATLREGGSLDHGFDQRMRALNLAPPGRESLRELRRISAPVIDLHAELKGTLSVAEDVTLDLTLPCGARIIGTVPDATPTGLLALSPSDISGCERQLLHWIRLLALASQRHRPDAPGPSADLYGISSSQRPQRLRLHAPDDPAASLSALVEVYRRALSGPLPLDAAFSPGVAAEALGAEHLPGAPVDDPLLEHILHTLPSSLSGFGALERLYGSAPPWLSDQGERVRTGVEDVIQLSAAVYGPLLSHTEKVRA